MTGRFKVMDRVRLRAGVEGPPERSGTVLKVAWEHGGYYVIHDSAIHAGPYGWAEHELEPLPWWCRLGRLLTGREP